MTERLAVISWSINHSSPEDGYIILGELYDSDTKLDIYEIVKDLEYFYPFRCVLEKDKIECHNIEDFTFLQEKYNLSYNLTYSKPIKKRQVMNFRSPVLYNLDKMEAYTTMSEPKFFPTAYKEDEMWIIVTPQPDPMSRGKIMDSCMEKIKVNREVNFLLLGRYVGRNKDRTNTLGKRYLRKQKIKEDNIFKLDYNLYETLTLYLNEADLDNVYIATTSKNMKMTMDFYKHLRQSGKIRKEIRFLCD